jgi:hypothetical protein
MSTTRVVSLVLTERIRAVQSAATTPALSALSQPTHRVAQRLVTAIVTRHGLRIPGPAATLAAGRSRWTQRCTRVTVVDRCYPAFSLFGHTVDQPTVGQEKLALRVVRDRAGVVWTRGAGG